ncbi:hypothetical protein SLS64_000904 [Diaporthe eres]|uniref:Transcription factor domain-containing protein n=1 Tax=Diaporthe eres TaxID=83184 RepID=A0ABR1NVP0_DIAER
MPLRLWFHAKPFYILDESSVRQRLQLNQLPTYLVHAIYAVAARYTPHPSGYQSAVKLSEEYATRARMEIDLDEPSIDALQACLLLVTAFTAAGKGKKAYMLLTALPIEGEFFQSASNLQYLQGAGKKSQGSSGMLIDISRILGITNRYLAAGGVKGDSHFPWHSLSNLSKIRQDLDIWASGTEDVFSSLDTLFGQNDSTVLVLSKLIYHLIHCLIYRPFLPIDLAELAGNGQHQSWQIEATNMCFLHANAIAELVELGKQTATIEWPAFVGYCICTAGTVHIHGAHYSKLGPGGEMSVFNSSAEFLSREMQQLSELRYAWASVQHQRETLQSIFNAHTELVKSFANMRYSPAFQLEDFFDRYSNIGGPGGQTFNFDAANLSLSDVVVDFTADAYTGHDLYAPRDQGSERPNLKRKPTLQGGRRRADSKSLAPLASNVNMNTHIHTGLPTPSQPRHPAFSTHGMPVHPPHPSPAMLHSPASIASHTGLPEHGHMNGMQDSDEIANNAAMAAAAAAGFSIPQHPQHPPPSQPQANPFSPPYASFGHMPSSTPGPASPPNNQNNTSGTSYDPMFGGLPTNAFSSPAAWNGNEGTPRPAGVQLAPSPGGMSNNGSTGTGPGEEKDPFLSLLEQLAENENARGPGSEFDFFFAGTAPQ